MSFELLKPASSNGDREELLGFLSSIPSITSSTASSNQSFCSTATPSAFTKTMSSDTIITISEPDYDTFDDDDGWWINSELDLSTPSATHHHAKVDSLTQSDLIVTAPPAILTSLEVSIPVKESDSQFLRLERPQLIDDTSWVSLDSTIDGVTPPLARLRSASKSFSSSRVMFPDQGRPHTNSIVKNEMDEVSRRRKNQTPTKRHASHRMDKRKLRRVETDVHLAKRIAGRRPFRQRRVSSLVRANHEALAWTPRDVRKWIESLDQPILHQYAEKFEQVGVRGVDLIGITLRFLNNDLMVMNSQHRRLLLTAIHDLVG